MNTQDLHLDIHAALKEAKQKLSEMNHQEINYGELPSMLHLHYMVHALRRDTKVYEEIDGEIREARRVYRPSDSIGRAMTAIVIQA